MSLHDTMIKHGHGMFRYRGYIPLLLLGPLLIAMKESVGLEREMGSRLEDLWVLFCFLLALSGLIMRWYTVGHVPAGTSGRNTKTQRADYLNTTGLYSIVRNPLYLGNFITILGVALSIKIWWLPLMTGLGFFIYMERIIMAEEAFLSEKYGKVYEDWRKRTPLIIPNLMLWKKPEHSFSVKTVLKREYPGLMGLGAAFFMTEFITDIFFEHESITGWFSEDFTWPLVFGMILAIGLTLRFLKKHTDILKVEGR
ncbi:MAG: isoprenylcysteine carboxylmethyltransferase family protein [Alphaproteobacteria bacterium]|nr:isoprenylcysteine carboxylmethyltransferase family protein [Alphaproteobacteria bacterium]